MDTEGVERIVILEDASSQRCCEDVGNRSGDNTDDDGTRGVHKAASRGDDDQSSDCTRAESKDSGLALEDPLHKGPGESTEGSGQRGGGEGVGGDHVGGDSATGVESIPADPEEGCTDEADD
jgi:hypothetical protein